MAKTSKTQKTSQKKLSPKKFAVIGLWVSGVAFLAVLVLLLVKLLALAKIYTLPNVPAFSWALAISAALIVLGLAFFALLDPQRVRVLLTGRQARYGSNAAIMLLAFVGILLVINIFVLQNPGTPFDFTEDKQNSLANVTLDTLKTLPSSVQATAFFTSQTPSDTARKLLENYKNNSNGKFTYAFIDPDQNPLAATQAGITGDGKIYLQMGNRHEIVALASEQDLTSGLVRLMNPGQKIIYFLTGHGERDIQTAGNTAYTAAKTALEAKNYTVQSLNLIATNKIPTDATVIVVAGPTQPISAAEATLLQDYVSKGGALIVMEEPTPLTQFGNSPDPLAVYLATSWGISFDNDIVIDTNTSQPLYAVAASYGTHPITEKLQGLVSFFPSARSLSVATNLTNQPTALVTTATTAWGETDFAALQTNGQVAFNSATDFPGPLTLAFAVSDATANNHVVIFGDADFASDAYFNQYANGDMFINAIDWAAGQEQLINLNTPTAISRTLVLPSSFWLLVMAISFLFILPGLVIAGGVVSWLVRRSRG
ncbi:MAG: Gldg family protein [Anaerolineales bacterium]|jgi:ABC-type uncharacterized transport system involved in gliding motility auxiliary subunit